MESHPGLTSTSDSGSNAREWALLTWRPWIAWRASTIEWSNNSFHKWSEAIGFLLSRGTPPTAYCSVSPRARRVMLGSKDQYTEISRFCITWGSVSNDQYLSHLGSLLLTPTRVTHEGAALQSNNHWRTSSIFIFLTSHPFSAQRNHSMTSQVSHEAYNILLAVPFRASGVQQLWRTAPVDFVHNEEMDEFVYVCYNWQPADMRFKDIFSPGAH